MIQQLKLLDNLILPCYTLHAKYAEENLIFFYSCNVLPFYSEETKSLIFFVSFDKKDLRGVPMSVDIFI